MSMIPDDFTYEYEDFEDTTDYTKPSVKLITPNGEWIDEIVTASSFDAIFRIKDCKTEEEIMTELINHYIYHLIEANHEDHQHVLEGYKKYMTQYIKTKLTLFILEMKIRIELDVVRFANDIDLHSM